MTIRLAAERTLRLLNDAKRAGGIPTSAQPVAQGAYGDGLRWWEYEDSSGKIKIVVKHPEGHYHEGTPKEQSEHHDGGIPKYYDSD